jgi:ubiquinone/menaquinone biosynthesis C-methylase UbiE
MVDAARRRFASETFVVGDARDLSAFPSEHFGLVLFSFNGIDAVDHDGRAQILREVRRVIRPGGYFVFNSHNHDGPSFRDRPWNFRPLTPLPARRAVYNLVRRVVELPHSVPNFRRLRAVSRDEGTHGVHPSASHRFGIVIYFASMAAQVDALDDAGFDSVEVYADVDGRRVAPDADTGQFVWLYYVARVPGASVTT